MIGIILSRSKSILGAVSIVVCAAVAAQGPAPTAVNPPPPVQQGVSLYRLAAGDVISIRVFNEPEFTQERIRLTDAGTISFPILGELPVLGRTVGEMEAVITGRLKGRVLVNPQVTVWIEQYRPFFINGMVERPGAYPYVPGLTVRKAASIAGGFRERASLNKIFVQREADPQGQKPSRQSVDTEIGPGDTIIVEESFF
jgi:polysaccharide biosynthesis/export protein VpsN